ncbi:MAG TPA: DnaJ domain-containing protein [Nocardioides sp.]|uniref:J domain-containing protein n=1 Tax=Nocardioides sp. TaxID=35761 RepID=UPI002E2F519F|nr:DnaJ domain-containing protein [Nocardioides sp.]HEX5088715.1 DnaJ domain-containing protein [Nocardioides sp.]
MTPTWYDLLGVERDASATEIRAAWKAAIADLDPTDRRFRTLNEAAEALLDKKKRKAYDAGLAPDEVEETHAGRTATDPESRDSTKPQRDTRTTSQRTIPAWLLAALAVVVAAALACAGYLYAQPSDAAIDDATSEAQSAAEHAVTTILAYDYRHLDADQKAADALMTPAYQKKYDPLFSQIAANAPDLKAVVTAQVVASGIVRSGEDRVQVLVFVNRPTSRADGSQLYRDQVVLTMDRTGGDWLVDDMDTNQLAG